MPIDLGFSAAIGVITSSVAGLVWAVRQEGRINGHDRLFEEREKQMMLRDNMLLERHNITLDALKRIESKVDSRVNHG